MPVAGAVVEPEHAGGVARGGARVHAAEGDDLGDRLAPVLVGHVLDHAVAALDREVDVDVRHRDALGVEEALEQQLVLDRVDVGDLQAVGDDRAGRRAAPRADGDAAVLGELDEVPDDQEVGREAHLLDHAQLHLEPLDGLGGRRVAVAACAAPRGRAGAGTPPRARRRASRSAGSASCRAPSRPRSARRSRAWWRSTPATRAKAAAISSESLRKNSLVSKVSFGVGERALGLHAQQRLVVVEVVAAAGSGRRRSRPAGGRARGRSGRCPRSPCPARARRSSGPRSRRPRGRRPAGARRRGRAPRCSTSSTRRRQKRDCRQPVRAITPSE